jgi:hypothetical protein
MRRYNLAMPKNDLSFLERFEKLRRRAVDMHFDVRVERTHIEIKPGLLKATDVRTAKTLRMDTVEELERFLDGVDWQRGYARELGFDERLAELNWWEERDRKRILENLSKD